MNNIRIVLKRVGKTPRLSPLPRPEYKYRGDGPRIALAVESMKRHMTDEGWQIMAGLEHGGYELYGLDLPNPETDVDKILERDPHIVVVQDKREWEGLTANRSRNPAMRFNNIGSLLDRNEVFKLTILKDAQNDGPYHCESAKEIGCHAWLVYYHPKIVCGVAPYVRERDCIRIYHTVDSSVIPPFDPSRKQDALLSGALSRAYPLRNRLMRSKSCIPKMAWMKHPGYGCGVCHTPKYLETLSKFKVVICTCSRYGYALRRLIEATACGCMVITDLPVEDKLPLIDGNFHRIPHTATTLVVKRAIDRCLSTYNPDIQHYYAKSAMDYYDYKVAGIRLAKEIEERRKNYGSSSV